MAMWESNQWLGKNIVWSTWSTLQWTVHLSSFPGKMDRCTVHCKITLIMLKNSIDPIPDNPSLLTALKKKSFEKNHAMFSTLPKTNFKFLVIIIVSFANAFNFDQSMILSFGKELNFILSIHQIVCLIRKPWIVDWGFNTSASFINSGQPAQVCPPLNLFFMPPH